jgi:hypothetical protein
MLRLALCTALAGLAQAQTLPLLIGDTNDPFVRSEARPSLGTGAWDKLVAGNLTGNDAPDVVAWNGGLLRLLCAPGLHRTELPVPGIVNPAAITSLAVLKGGAIGGLDALVFADAGGLHVWSFDPDNGGRGTLDSLSHGMWQNATAIATHPSDPTVIFGLRSTNQAILVANLDPQTRALSHFSDTSLRGPASTIECSDHGSGVHAHAVVNGIVYSYDTQGSEGPTATLDTPTYVANTVSLARLRHSNGTEELVVLRAQTNGTPSCKLDHVYGGTGAIPVGLGGNAFVAVTTGDVSADGTDDLLLSTAANTETTFLLNMATAGLSSFAYQPYAGMRIAVGTPTGVPANDIACVATDIDNDLDADLVVARNGTGTGTASVQYVSNLLYTFPPLSGLGGASVLNPNAVSPTIRYSFPFSQPTSGNRVQIVGWKATVQSAQLQSPPQPVLDPQILGNPAVNVLATWQTGVPSAVEIDLDRNFLLNQNGVYYFLSRPVIVDAQDNVVAAAPGDITVFIATPGAWDAYNFNGGGVRVNVHVNRARFPRAPSDPPPSPRLPQ